MRDALGAAKDRLAREMDSHSALPNKVIAADLAAESRAAAARAFLDHDDDGRLWSSVCGKRRRACALDRSCWRAAWLDVSARDIDAT